MSDTATARRDRRRHIARMIGLLLAFLFIIANGAFALVEMAQQQMARQPGTIAGFQPPELAASAVRTDTIVATVDDMWRKSRNC